MELIESLKLIGPSRFCDCTSVELHLEFSSEDIEVISNSEDALYRSVCGELSSLGVADRTLPEKPATESSGAASYCELLASTALALQRHAGFQVAFSAGFDIAPRNCGCAVVEHDHGDAGLEAMRLAVETLERAFPKVTLPPPETRRREDFQQLFSRFMAAAPERRLPNAARDIIQAAEALDVPWVNLDLDPYEGIEGDFRILPNGMLKLGHACYQRVLDGPLLVDADQTLLALAHDRAASRRLMESLGLPLPQARFCRTAQEATQAAASLPAPWMIKPWRIGRSRSFGPTLGNLADEAALREAVAHVLGQGPGLVMETQAPGTTYKAVLSGSQLISLVEVRSGHATAVVDDVPQQTLALLTACAQACKNPLVVVTLVSTDITQPLGQTGCVTGLDVAPDLSRFLPDDGLPNSQAIRSRAARGLVSHLFPEDKPSRIPLVSVTGTNGKSTVCFMLSRLMRQAGFKIGRANTTGLYINDQRISEEDSSGAKEHFRVLENPEINFAILETARGAATGLGFAFDRSDVSVCTNVTADHLGERGVETVEDMAQVKWSITNRARRAVVLNADDPLCAAMHQEFPGREVWLVSQELNEQQLKAQFPQAAGFCLAQQEEGQEWVALIHGDSSHPVLPVTDIPLTGQGTARFNVSNALQACAAAHLMGASLEQLRSGLRLCVSDFQNNPGRMNHFDGLPFQVLFDFVHNEAGHRALRRYVDALEVPGARRIILAPRGENREQDLKALALVVAEGYDYFYCHEHPRKSARAPGETAEMLAQALIGQGVAKSRITTSPDISILESVLEVCRPGDLLVATTTIMKQNEQWATLEQFRQRHHANTEGKLNEQTSELDNRG